MEVNVTPEDRNRLGFPTPVIIDDYIIAEGRITVIAVKESIIILFRNI